MNKKMKLGIIGTGGIVRTAHVPAIRKLDQVNLVAICDINKQKVVRLAKEWGVEEVYDKYQDIVNSKNVDAVLIASPNSYHKEHVVAAARAGKHVFCEKPIATTIEDACEIVEVCAECEVKLQIGFVERFWNQVQITKELVDSGFVGKIKSYDSIYCVDDEDVDEIDTPFRNDFRICGGGCLMDAGIHQIDMARYLMGEIRRVCAEVKHSVGGFGGQFEDNTLILCNFDNGAIGSISTNRFSPFMHKTFLYGSEGTIFLSTHTFFQSSPLAVYSKKDVNDIPEQVLKYFYRVTANEKPSRRWISITPPIDDPYFIQLRSFCRSIIEDTLPPVTGHDGIKSLEIVLSAYNSSKERAWMEISE